MMRFITCILFAIFVYPTILYAQDFRYATMIPMVFEGSSGGIDVHTLDGNTDEIHHVMYAREAATVTSVCFYYSLRTGTPPTYKVGIEGVSTSTGNANGTYKTGTGECSATFTPPASAAWDDTWQCQTLTGTTCSVTRGEPIAITIKYSSGTINASNKSAFGVYQNASYNNTQGMFSVANNEYVVTVEAATPTQQPNTPLISYKNGSRTFGFPVVSLASQQYSSDSTPDEYAMRFQLPCPVGQSYVLAGMNCSTITANSGITIKATLYNGTTAIDDVTLDSDQVRDEGQNGRQLIFLFDDVTPPSLDCATTYRIGLAPQQTGSGFGVIIAEVTANSDFDAYPLGIETYMSTRSDAGAWTDVTNKRIKCGLILDKLNTVSGGGTVISSGMSGGFQ